MLIKELLLRQRNNPKIAIKQKDKEISYHDWYQEALALCRKIQEILTLESQNVAILLPNSIDYAIAYFSITFADKLIVPIGVQSKADEIISTLSYCEIDLIITSHEYEDKLKLSQLLKTYNHQIYSLFIDDLTVQKFNSSCTAINKTYQNSIGKTADDIAILLHTSGTISQPKRVMLTHTNLISNVESNIQYLNLNKDDKVLISMPMHFGYCNTSQFLSHLYLGASMVILEGPFMPKTFLETVQNERITNFTGVPSTFLILLNYRYEKKYDFSSLRYICFGGANMPVNKLRELVERYKTVGFVYTYGQSEASTRITALMPDDLLRKPGSVGLPIPGVQIKVVDDSGRDAPKNEIGEIIIRGKNVMKGYYKREELTRQTIMGGWLYSGDIGYLDEEGYLYIKGRKRNIIISGGINIFAEEVEEILMQHPAVLDVCVLGAEHPLLGEVPVASIVLREGVDTENLKFREFCKKRLSDYKVPAKFEIVTKLEKTYNGKIKRNKE